jgi:hypothetical protein
MPLILTTETNPGTASWTDAGLLGYVVHQIRVQLADLPAAPTTGNLSFGSVIPANTVVIGASIRVNTAVALGGSGITIVNVTTGVFSANLITTADVVGAGSGTYINAFNDAPSFTIPPVVTDTTGQPVFAITSDGPDLNLLAAFDVTIFVIASTTVLTVP